MADRSPVFEAWKLTVVTVVAGVLLVDLHVMFRSISASADKLADSYAKQAETVTESANEMANIMLPADVRKDYQRLATRGHRLLIRQLEDNLKRAEAEEGHQP